MARTSSGSKFVGLVLFGPVIIAVVSVLAMLFGAAAGWLAGLIFPQVFERLTTLIFGEEIPAWQLGAMLGFIATFLRTSFPNRR
ncbi:hypothetical protein K3152_12315 [Qipengyuania sp. 1NDH17]|uniref:Uncharacterized protein n=1 Tax=Qipengyuania polymorpha TaxID=2867234 RepID=A0ABS7IZN2_9SPHN|nr:hypothetical protein [Qipengyuania polymorpha]MBX7459035.1 hypothetical protein [Qipengyuania polymorpha]